LKILANKHLKAMVGFIKNDETVYHASSLSFFTIFAITPTLLIFISVLSYAADMEQTIMQMKDFLFRLLIPTHRTIIESYIDSFFANSGKMGIIGVIYVLVTSMMFFLNYEFVINRIFNTKTRNFLQTITIYSLITILSPIALALSIYLSSGFQKIVVLMNIKSIDASSLLPFFIIWALFFINYKISPNKLMLFKPVLISSFTASLVWYMAKNAFVQYIFYNKTYVSLYGSVSILIIFFLWIYVSWMIFIYGLELAKFLEDREERKSLFG